MSDEPPAPHPATPNSATSKPRERVHLPVLGSAPPEPGDEERPPWHWSAIGAVAIFLAWLPLAAGASYLAARSLEAAPPGEVATLSLRARALMVGSHALAFALASFAGGFLVGRFGGKAGPKEAAAAGLFAATLAWALAAAQPGGAGPGAIAWALILAAVVAIGAGAAWAGGRVGLRGRSKGGA